jgi:hypothetical protein
MSEQRDPNWTQVGPFLPLATLSDGYKGPILLADESQTIRWFVAEANKRPIEHKEHRRDEQLGFLHQPQTEEQQEAGQPGDPVIDSRTVEPAFWAFAEIVR